MRILRIPNFQYFNNIERRREKEITSLCLQSNFSHFFSLHILRICHFLFIALVHCHENKSTSMIMDSILPKRGESFSLHKTITLKNNNDKIYTVFKTPNAPHSNKKNNYDIYNAMFLWFILSQNSSFYTLDIDLMLISVEICVNIELCG